MNQLERLDRRDLYARLGWVQCGTCNETTTKVEFTEGLVESDAGPVMSHCPDCFAGLIPPDDQIKAAGQAIARNDAEMLGEVHESVHDQSYESGARAALVAAARTGDTT